MKKKIKKEHVEQAVKELKEAGLLADTGPQSDGTRNGEQWLNAIGEDHGIIQLQLKDTLRQELSREEIVKNIAVAIKEANRLLSDINRFARDVHNVTKEELDQVGPL